MEKQMVARYVDYDNLFRMYSVSTRFGLSWRLTNALFQSNGSNNAYPSSGLMVEVARPIA